MQEIEQRREQLPTTAWMHDYRDVGGRVTQGAVADDCMDAGDRATQGAVAE
jgi:hypothetical protein